MRKLSELCPNATVSKNGPRRYRVTGGWYSGQGKTENEARENYVRAVVSAMDSFPGPYESRLIVPGGHGIAVSIYPVPCEAYDSGIGWYYKTTAGCTYGASRTADDAEASARSHLAQIAYDNGNGDGMDCFDSDPRFAVQMSEHASWVRWQDEFKRVKASDPSLSDEQIRSAIA